MLFIMRRLFSIILTLVVSGLFAQESSSLSKVEATTQQAWVDLIDSYAQAREVRDTSLLKEILVEDIDQLVSTGEWRRGLRTAVAGMQRSSSRNPGNRTLTVEHSRLITPSSGIVDCRYEILNPDGSLRKMWSTFIVVKEEDNWKIAGIRNMLPRK